MLTVVTTQTVPGHSGVTLLARIVGNAWVPITRATLSAIAVTVTDLTLEAALLGSGFVATLAPTVASTVFDGLQTGPPWTKDSQQNPGPDGLFGYNFLYTVPAANFVNATYTVLSGTGVTTGDRYRCDVRFTPVAGESFAVAFEFQTLKMYG